MYKVELSASATAIQAHCPRCQQLSTRVHSYYRRSPRDLPWGAQAVRLVLQVRRFRCLNPQCPQRTFAERLPELLPAHAQRTTRLTQALRAVAMALGGEAGARVAGQLRLPSSGDTLLRIIRQPYGATPPTPRVLGVDDWVRPVPSKQALCA